MRVADRSTIRNYLKYLDNAKNNSAETSERIASGSRFVRISDDVSAGTRALRVRGDMAKAQEHYNNVKTVNEELISTENAMTSISEIINKVHSQKVVKALNDPTGEGGREAIANEVAAMKLEMLQFANSKHYNRYVLGGSSAANAPFTIDDASGKLKYNGIDVDTIQKDDNGYYYLTDPDDATSRKEIPMDGDIFVDIGLGIRMSGTDAVSDTAMKISYSGLDILGFGTSDGMSNNLFNVINDIEKAIRDGDDEKLRMLDGRLVSRTTSFTANLTEIGAKTSFLETISGRLEDELDSYQRQVSNIMGINDAEEASKQSMNQYVLKAVLAMGAQVIPPSLMDYLN